MIRSVKLYVIPVNGAQQHRQWWSVSATQWGYPRIRGIPAPAVWLKGSPPHCADTHSRLPIIYNGAHNPHEWRPPPDCSEWLPVREPHTATTRQCGTPSLGGRASCRSQEQLPHLASTARVKETWSPARCARRSPCCCFLPKTQF